MLSVNLNGLTSLSQGHVESRVAASGLLDVTRVFGIAWDALCLQSKIMSSTLPIKVLPSLLAADMGRLAESCLQAEQAGADGLHIDIMDGHFVPNLSMGPDVVRMARKHFRKHLSVHLMVTHPQHFIDVFAGAGADTLLIHVEARCNVRQVLADIRRHKIRAGITLNPETPEKSVSSFLDLTDEILCMTVHPGFGGQRFIREVLPKISRLRTLFPRGDISVDGGITSETAALCAERGANIFLVGTAVFGSQDPSREIQSIRETAQSAFMKNQGPSNSPSWI